MPLILLRINELTCTHFKHIYPIILTTCATVLEVLCEFYSWLPPWHGLVQLEMVPLCDHFDLRDELEVTQYQIQWKKRRRHIIMLLFKRNCHKLLNWFRTLRRLKKKTSITASENDMNDGIIVFKVRGRILKEINGSESFTKFFKI